MKQIETAAPMRVQKGRLGRGVFATRAIEARETIEICPTLTVDDGDVGGRLADYVLASAYDDSKAILMLGYGMLYNHSETPNAEYVEHSEDEIAFIATEAIEAGDEITISYGPQWWETRELSPE